MSSLSWRIAEEADIPAISELQTRSIEELQKPFLTPEQIESSKKTMGLDRQLVSDRTYFMIEGEGRLAGCGGWGRRATLFGGTHSAGRSDAFLDAQHEPARIRAMYASPDFTRRGVGKLLLALGELAASEEGFSELTLGSTLAGMPLYEAYGFRETARVDDAAGDGFKVPVITMTMQVDRARAETIVRNATGESTNETAARLALARDGAAH
jgi:GNAT superfamily N-acetyltransferase